MNAINSNQAQKIDIAEQAMAKASSPSLPYMQGLNDEQKQAVLNTEGPLLVLAGAGTGKTRVLTTRIAHILAKRLAWHSQILAVTFTNKAAHEMGERVQNLSNNKNENLPWLGTFHSIGAKMLRRHAELVGLTNKFTIIDTDDQVRLLKQLIELEDIDKEQWPARILQYYIDSWKNNAMWPKNINKYESEKFADGRGKKLYKDYQERLLALNVCDFGDLLLHPIKILRDNPDILQSYQKQFKYILVDEYQDTNVAQYLWLRLLAGTHSQKEKINICCVGDDDQSIYGWRGAQVKNILNFEKEFEGTEIIRLERNYRSTASILACASHLISYNEGRLGKTLYPDDSQETGETIKVNNYVDSFAEAACVANDIKKFVSKREKLNDMAVLVRATFQMREFEKRFGKEGLKYRVYGGPRFYERLEIRDAIAYFRLTYQPSDDLAFERIINKPKRGLGDTTLQIIRTHAQAKKISLTQSTEELLETEEIKTKQKETLKNLLISFSRWRNLVDKMELYKLADLILIESDYMEMWKNDASIKAPERVENLHELILDMQGHENIEEFLMHVGLVMDNNANANEDAITLSTLHAAKGLEFKNVFLPGWEESLFPHENSLAEVGGLEEERRLAYVGITRAKNRCHISYVNERSRYGRPSRTPPSRFIDELSPQHIEKSALREFYDPAIDSNSRQTKMINDKIHDNNFSIKERVFHLKFGYGIIKDIDGDNLKIIFDKAGEKNAKISFIYKRGQEPVS